MIIYLYLYCDCVFIAHKSNLIDLSQPPQKKESLSKLRQMEEFRKLKADKDILDKRLASKMKQLKAQAAEQTEQAAKEELLPSRRKNEEGGGGARAAAGATSRLSRMAPAPTSLEG